MSPALGLPDILAKDLALIFCGINPGTTAAVSGHHFSHASNRFWRVLHLAGFTPHLIVPEHDREILDYGCGLTTVAPRATRRASDLSRTELSDAREQLQTKIEKYRPRAIAFLGKPGYAALIGATDFPWGRQAIPFAGAKVWVLPNPSGLNRNFDMPELVRAYAALRRALGLGATRLQTRRLKL